MGSATGPLEVPTDEMKVKLVSVTVFLQPHSGAWVLARSRWRAGLNPGLWFCPGSGKRGEASLGVESVCPEMMVIIGCGQNGRKWMCGLKNCWS